MHRYERSAATVLKIAIVGPESSGKTTLTEALAHHYRCAFTKEYARTYLEDNGPAYVEEDLMQIAGGQLLVDAEAEKHAQDHGDALMICDTDMLTIRIWSEEKFGRCHPLLMRLVQDVHYDLWLLCKPDIPWQPDPLRENPDDRDRLFAVYEDRLRTMGKPYAILHGSHGERMQSAVQEIDRWIV
ncbi:MAG: ATP-binding protein [Flavobacteriales bacterium]|nr:ATP-binding protein [Flavobacteriales bacterium]